MRPSQLMPIKNLQGNFNFFSIKIKKLQYIISNYTVPSIMKKRHKVTGSSLWMEGAVTMEVHFICWSFFRISCSLKRSCPAHVLVSLLSSTE